MRTAATLTVLALSAVAWSHGGVSEAALVGAAALLILGGHTFLTLGLVGIVWWQSGWTTVLLAIAVAAVLWPAVSEMLRVAHVLANEGLRDRLAERTAVVQVAAEADRRASLADMDPGPRGPTPTGGASARDPFDHSLLTIEAHGAMEVAAARRGNRPLGTCDILAAIVAMDAAGSWQTVLLRTMFVTFDDALAFPDADAQPAGSWHNVPLTGDAAAALRVAARIATDFDLRPMPPGVLALGLVWSPRAGATRALLGGAEVDHRGLIDLLQTELLDVRLEGLADSWPETHGDALPEPGEDEPRPARAAALWAPPSGAPSPRDGVAIASRAPHQRPAPVAARFDPVAPTAGPFTTGHSTAAISPDVTQRSGAGQPSGSVPGPSDVPDVGEPLAGKLATAERLRTRTTATQAWVFAIDGRVLKIYDLRALDDREQARIAAEASIGLSLGDIEGVVATLSVTEDNGYLVIEMPRMGASLQDHIDRSSRGLEPRLPPESYAAALARVSSTLQSLHDRGLVHRHVKPTNLLVEPDTNWLALADFAIARGVVEGDVDEPAQAGRWRRLTRSREVPGTDRYIAPEQHLGAIGPSLDQYALGVTARDVLTAPGAPPLTTPVHEVLQRATAPRPASRFASIAEFGRALTGAVRDEAPRGLAEHVAGLPPTSRAALTPALLAIIASIAIAALDVHDGSLGLTLTFLGELLLIVVSVVMVGGVVILAGTLRQRCPWTGLQLADRPLVPLVACMAVAAAWLLARPDASTVSILICVLGGVYGARTFAGRRLGRHTAAGLVGALRRWERRRFMSPMRRRALSTVVTLLGIAAIAAPMIVALAWPGRLELPTTAVGDYGPLTVVWNFRAAAGARDTAAACDMLARPPGMSRSASCPDLVRIVGALERTDPVAHSTTPAFGGSGTFETYRVQEIPAPAAVRAWRLLAPGGREAGSMYTEGAGGDRVTIMVSRLQPSNGPTSRSTWLYELVLRAGRWKLVGFRACVIPAGPGRPPAKCAITDAASADYVRQLLAAARRRGHPP
jgi:tRNA A-37 threonylcarbamoyl transferase component Bud32